MAGVVIDISAVAPRRHVMLLYFMIISDIVVLSAQEVDRAAWSAW
jgi:hypothetical protein